MIINNVVANKNRYNLCVYIVKISINGLGGNRTYLQNPQFNLNFHFRTDMATHYPPEMVAKLLGTTEELTTIDFDFNKSPKLKVK
jgi:hypothetical protein